MLLLPCTRCLTNGTRITRIGTSLIVAAIWADMFGAHVITTALATKPFHQDPFAAGVHWFNTAADTLATVSACTAVVLSAIDCAAAAAVKAAAAADKIPTSPIAGDNTDTTSTTASPARQAADAAEAAADSVKARAAETVAAAMAFADHVNGTAAALADA